MLRVPRKGPVFGRLVAHVDQVGRPLDLGRYYLAVSVALPTSDDDLFDYFLRGLELGDAEVMIWELALWELGLVDIRSLCPIEDDLSFLVPIGFRVMELLTTFSCMVAVAVESRLRPCPHLLLLNIIRHFASDTFRAVGSYHCLRYLNRHKCSILHPFLNDSFNRLAPALTPILVTRVALNAVLDPSGALALSSRLHLRQLYSFFAVLLFNQDGSRGLWLL